MKTSQATQGDGEFFNDVTFRSALKSFEYKLFADSSMSSPVLGYMYIQMHTYTYIYMTFLGMYSWILHLYLLALPVGKLWKWNARHATRKSLRLLGMRGPLMGGGGVVAIVNEPKSYPSHAKYTQTAQAVHTRKNYASHSTHFCVVLATLWLLNHWRLYLLMIIVVRFYSLLFMILALG